MVLERRFRSLTQAILLFFSRSCLRTGAQHLLPCWAAGHVLFRFCAHDSLGIFGVE